MPRFIFLFAGVLAFSGCARNSDVTALKARVADLEQKNARLEKSYERDLASIQVKVLDLEQQLAESESAYADASKETIQIDDDVDGLKSRLNSIKSDLDDLNLRLKSELNIKADTTELLAVEERVDAIQKKLNAIKP
jgi:chromosome segregation ATPase